MNSKNERALIIVLFVLLFGSVVLFFMNKIDKNQVVIEVPKSNSKINVNDSILTKYRSENLPEECRLPEYEFDVHWWKEHLSHHGKTQFCLQYYSDLI